MRTFQTRIQSSKEIDEILQAYAGVCSQVERSLFTDIQKKEAPLPQLKSTYLKRFGITARQFNGCRISVEGKISSLKEIQKQRLAELKEKQERFRSQLLRKGFKRNRHLFHQKLQRIEAQHQRLQRDRENGIVRLCFGGRKLFNAQHHLEKCGFKTHEEWLQEWRKKRNAGFFLMGSKDETGGNQSCTASIQENGLFSLRLRLPDSISSGKYLTLNDIKLGYGHKAIVTALQECTARADLQKRNEPEYRKRGTPLSYRFLKDKKGWRLFVSIEEPSPSPVTQPSLGYIGVDLNANHLAVAATNCHGNPVAITTYPLNTYGKTKEQIRAQIGDTAKALVGQALEQRKPLVLEKLDFTRKKRLLKENTPKHARMLSSFAYQRTVEAIKARAVRSGVQIIEVNPAYTSQIGKIKFAKRYGLSNHHAAAVSIARRAAGFSEKLPTRADVPDGKGAHVAFVVPAWNRHRTFWAYLGEVSRKLRTALAEHFRETKCPSIEAKAPT
jgi:IS605 OrfB family transposase